VRVAAAQATAWAGDIAVGNGFCGGTAIYASTGACLAQLDGHERGLAVAELDQTA
jgi:predicted amidohydrolase